MITVTLNTNGRYWQMRWTDLVGKRRCRGLGLRSNLPKKQAEIERRRLELDLNCGRVAKGEAPTLQQHLDRFFANRTNLADGTRLLYQHTARYLLAYFSPNLRLDRLTAATATDFRAVLAKGELSHVNIIQHRSAPCESTVCRHIREAKSIFQMAVDDEQIPSNPFRKVNGTSPIPDKDWAYVDQATLDTLFEVCPTTGWRLMLALPRLAGLRRGEAWRLQWSDVDLVSRRLTVRNPQTHRSTKKRTRQVPLVPTLYDLLFEAANDDSSDEFVIARGSTPRPDQMHKGFGQLCRMAGVEPWARWCHTLRKNCETDWAGQYPIHVVTEWLGNSPVVAMQHYVHATDADFDRLAGNEAQTDTVLTQSTRDDASDDS